jgi:hypothetical protein
MRGGEGARGPDPQAVWGCGWVVGAKMLCRLVEQGAEGVRGRVEALLSQSAERIERLPGHEALW